MRPHSWKQILARNGGAVSLVTVLALGFVSLGPGAIRALVPANLMHRDAPTLVAATPATAGMADTILQEWQETVAKKKGRVSSSDAAGNPALLISSQRAINLFLLQQAKSLSASI